jgi:hypothetical protein
VSVETTGLYTLDDAGNPVATHDVLEWGRWYEKKPNRIIASTEIDGLRVSTVFLGIDHNLFDGGPPLLFETMIFGAPVETTLLGRTRTMSPALDYQERYSTRDQAIAGHTRAVDAVLAKRVRFVDEESPK